MYQLAQQVPHFNPIIDTQTRGERCGKNEFAVGRPFAMRCIGRVNCGYLCQRTSVVYVNLSREIAETSKKEQPRLRVERYVVTEGSAEVVQRPNALIEKHYSGRHD
jgi:hypothetical protein